MTARRDLKKRVRERQARTGERYTTALAQVLQDRPPSGVPVVELVDVSAQAAASGLKGRVLMFPELSRRVRAERVLRRLRDVLLATRDEPTMHLFHAVLLDGERVSPKMRPNLAVFPQNFLERARAGVGGVSPSGLMLAIPVEARRGMEMVIGLFWGLPVTVSPPHGSSPSLVLRSAEGMLAERWERVAASRP